VTFGLTWTRLDNASIGHWSGVAVSGDCSKIVAVQGIDPQGNLGSIFASNDSGQSL